MPKQKRQSPTKSETHRPPTTPRPLSQRERTLIALYCNCQLKMTPQQFYAKWQVTQQDMASICLRSLSTVQCWFRPGHRHRRPTANDLHHLAVMDFLLEHFEDIPNVLLELLCSRK